MEGRNNAIKKEIAKMNIRDMKKNNFYENFASEFDTQMNKYDLSVRLKVVFEQLLPEDISGKKLLDAGCGTGFFSAVGCKKGAFVTSMDLGPKLLNEVSKKCESTRVIGSVLDMEFKNDQFDFIVCSEVIEHTQDPYKALRELYRVLKPNGTLALTVPNRFWKWSCIFANALNLRPYAGIENWLGYYVLKRELKKIGFRVTQYFGFHLFPFHMTSFLPLLRKLDKYGNFIGQLYINIATSCIKI